MFNCWYFLFILINSLQAQNPFDGGGFLGDPFLELTAGVTTPVNQKSNKSEPTCITNGALAGSIIATLLLSAFIAFLTWMVYLRQKLHELKSYDDRGRNFYEQNCHFPSSHVKQISFDQTDQNGNPLPLDVTDFKFGTFPFRQSQTPNTNGHSNANEWLNRVPSSFRSSTSDQNFQTMDIELLNPTFCGLNFSITGNMRSGIFIREILDKETAKGQVKLNSSDQLRTGDRILALTICFESIVYEDALTILSYASPYPVILRVQRPIHPIKSSTITEKRTGSTNKVKWRDDFEHYDNDTPYNRSVDQMDSSKTLISETKKPPIPTKGNKKKTSASSSATKQKNKRLNPKKKVIENKKSNPIILPSTGLSSKPIEKQTPSTKKSVANAVMSYLHYRGTNGIYSTDAGNPSEGGAMTYYDSPYDYYSAHLNRNNNNNNNNDSVDIEPLSTVKSTYHLELSQTKMNPSTERMNSSRQCQRRLSSSGVSLSSTIDKPNPKDSRIDTFV